MKHLLVPKRYETKSPWTPGLLIPHNPCITINKVSDLFYNRIANQVIPKEQHPHLRTQTEVAKAILKGTHTEIGAYEQLGYTEKQANSIASVTSGLRSPTKILWWPKKKHSYPLLCNDK